MDALLGEALTFSGLDRSPSSSFSRCDTDNVFRLRNSRESRFLTRMIRDTLLDSSEAAEECTEGE